jgi:predicted phage replisome organizer
MEEQKKYYWLKLKRDFFKRHDIRIVEEMPNGKDYILFYLKMLVESVDHEGELRFSDTIPYNEAMLATITNTNLDIVRAAMKIFTELQMIEIMDDGTYYMTEVMKMIGSASNSDTANRQRRFREKKRQELCANNTDSVTKSNAGVTLGVTKDNESKSKRKEIEGELEKKEEAPARDDNGDVFLNAPVTESNIDYLLDILFNVCPNAKNFDRGKNKDIWLTSFSGIKANVLYAAVTNHIRTNGYFPTVKEIFDQIKRAEITMNVQEEKKFNESDVIIPEEILDLFGK